MKAASPSKLCSDQCGGLSELRRKKSRTERSTPVMGGGREGGRGREREGGEEGRRERERERER